MGFKKGSFNKAVFMGKDHEQVNAVRLHVGFETMNEIFIPDGLANRFKLRQEVL